MQGTVGPTEADLESRIDATIRLAFPLLPRDGVRHQTTFSFRLGGNKITVDGKEKDAAHSRSDVILYFQDKPLAVLELKRNGLALTEDDSKQGLSYARVLDPSPPLVVISNGQIVRLVETHSGNDWHPAERTEQTVAALIQSSARLAANDVKLAVSTLMGTNPDVWVQAIRHTSATNIEELSGEWKDRLLPFVRGFLIPRKATRTVKEALQQGARFIILEGVPLAGKSNVLRELVQSMKSDPSLVVLFIESEGSVTVLQQIADTLAQQLNWPVSKNEARDWLKRLSQSNGPRLAVVIDGIGLELAKSRDEIVELTSPSFGAQLSVVVELDDTCAKTAVLNSSGRGASAIGRRAKRVVVEALDDEEFTLARDALWSLRLGMGNGAESSYEMHIPWVLRAVCSKFVAQPQYRDHRLAGIIPSLLSLDLIQLTRNTFEEETRSSFRAVAAATLEDTEDLKRPISLILESMSTYVVRRTTLKKYLEHAELERLKEQGYLKQILHDSGEDVFVVRVPELVASEAAWVVAMQIPDRIKRSPVEAAKWLSTTAANLPLGDIVAAQAIIDAAKQGQHIPLNLITSMMEHPPQMETLTEGSCIAMHLPGEGTLHVTVQSGGLFAKTKNEVEFFMPFDKDDLPNVTYSDIHWWLILSHLAGFPCAINKEGHDEVIQRLDPSILLKVGTCPIVLRRPSADPRIDGIPTHEIENHGSMVCHNAGIVEPITLSIYKYLCLEGRKAMGWVQAATEKGSFPLLARMDIALREISQLADTELSGFAKEASDLWVRPALSTLPPLH